MTGETTKHFSGKGSIRIQRPSSANERRNFTSFIDRRDRGRSYAKRRPAILQAYDMLLLYLPSEAKY